MYKLVLLVCWLVTVHGGGSPIRSYAFSYATPDGQSRFETSRGGNLNGGYQYRTPEGAVVAVRYSNDEHAFRATGDSYTRHYNLPGAYRRLYSYTSGGKPLARSFATAPKQSYAFSYATPDGQSRYETNEEGAVKGGYKYTTPEGAVVAVRYTADENGFRTTGNNYIVHGVKPGSSRQAYSYSYSGFPLSRPVIRVQPQESVIPTARYIQPVSYYHGHPNTYYGANGFYHGFPYSYLTGQRYTVPADLIRQQYKTSSVTYEPVEAFGYVISH